MWIMKLLLFISILLMSYELSKKLMRKNVLSKINYYLMEKNEKYYEELLKYYEKNKKVKITTNLNCFHKTNILIERAGIKRSILINPITIFCVSIFLIIFMYIIAFNFFKIILLSIIVSLPAALVPFIILHHIANMKEEQIEKILLNFLLQLKNYTKISNDIVSAFKQVVTIEPLQGYIKTFLIELNSGIKFEMAMENLKEKITIERLKIFLSNIQHCYLYGGSFSELIEKNYNMIKVIQKEKIARIRETKSARTVLIILIFLNLFVYITFIRNNYENYKIMQGSIIGNLILYWNFITIWFLMFLSNRVKKLDY